MTATGACPRCNTPLIAGYGDLGEDVCGGCDGRLLSPELTRRVLIDEGGVSADLIRDLAEHFAGARLTCPACRGEMSPVTIKSTPIDVCLGCGATFLDAGELAKISAGKHGESLAPSQLIRPVDRLPQQDEAPADPRHTWEKALPMYAIEAVGVLVWLSYARPAWTPVHATGVALAIVSVPLMLSMLVDVDMRSMFRGRGFGSYGFGYGRRGGGMLGVVLLVLGVVVGGTISTVNALIAERLPKKIARWGSVAVLGGMAAWAVLATVLG